MKPPYIDLSFMLLPKQVSIFLDTIRSGRCSGSPIIEVQLCSDKANEFLEFLHVKLPRFIVLAIEPSTACRGTAIFTFGLKVDADRPVS